jgi:hypothetical protein|tara:strand:+ start:240 stop:839 length:600 start_codon:yes stop_codon:yes gene_type:complete
MPLGAAKAALLGAAGSAGGAGDWEVIATTSATVNTASISFASIPQTYTDLKIVYAGTSPDGEFQLMNFATGGGSPDTTNTNYGVTGMMVWQSGSSSAGWYIVESAWRKFPISPWPRNGFPNVGIFDIPNYTSTSFYKVAQGRSSNRCVTTATGSSANGGGMSAYYTWKNTGALDRVDMTRDSGSGYDDFTCTLFGIGPV